MNAENQEFVSDGDIEKVLKLMDHARIVNKPTEKNLAYLRNIIETAYSTLVYQQNIIATQKRVSERDNHVVVQLAMFHQTRDPSNSYDQKELIHLHKIASIIPEHQQPSIYEKAMTNLKLTIDNYV